MGHRAKGYYGHKHETLGSDILAIQKILKHPEQVLGKEEAAKLAAVDPNAWYPIEWLLSLMDRLDREIGQYGLLQMGRRLFELSHEKRVITSGASARDIVYGIDAMYRHANRGTSIGGWKVLEFGPGHAKLEKTTPHHCMMEQGILTGALATVGCPATIAQPKCLRLGAPACIYVITSSITDARWMGKDLGSGTFPAGPRERP
jgi:hypothetical protein